MKQIRRLFLALIFLLGLLAPAAFSLNAPGNPDYVPGEIIVKFKSSIILSDEAKVSNQESLNQLFERKKVSGLKPLLQKTDRLPSTIQAIKKRFPKRAKRIPKDAVIPDLSRIYIIEVSKEADIESLAREFKANPFVEYAHPNYYLWDDETMPPNYSALFHYWHKNDGVTVINPIGEAGRAGADIKSTFAWDITQGSPEVTIAVLDSGLSDPNGILTGLLWENGAEKNGSPGVDDDANGYVDDINGWNFYDNASNEGKADFTDDSGHGTEVASLATTNWKLYSLGVTRYCRLMILRRSGKYGSNLTASLKGILYAVNNGADIINCSWGRDTLDGMDAISNAIDSARANGVLVVASAGNSAVNIDPGQSPHYPASFSQDNIISVAATNHLDNLHSTSNYGSESVDLAAPGYQIMTATKDGGLVIKSGTSFSAPLVSGAAALMLSVDPALSPQDIRTILMDTADRLPSLEGKVVSGGRLNVYRALLKVIGTQIITSVQSGYWNDKATWAGGKMPSPIDSVIIAAGHQVLFDRNDATTTCGTIEIKNGGTLKIDSTPVSPKTMQVKGNINVYGKLELVPGSTLKIECETNGQYGIIVYAGGELKGTGSVPTVLTTLASPLQIGEQVITVTNSSGFGIGDIITLGDGANAEGFTISAVNGNQITLNRKALNAQVMGAEVYKNATVTTSNISAGSKTFTVADLGGIKAGDRIAVATTSQGSNWEDQTEIRNVESVSFNLITATQAFSYSHSAGAIVVKTNRDALITSTMQDSEHNGYLLIKNNGNLQMRYIESSYLYRPPDSGADAGIFIFTPGAVLAGNSIHDVMPRTIFSEDANDAKIISNIVFSSTDGLCVKSIQNYIISNILFRNTSSGLISEVIGNTSSRKNIYLSNYSFSNNIGYAISREDNIFLYNSAVSNGYEGALLSSLTGPNVIYGNIFERNFIGLLLNNNAETEILSTIVRSNSYGIDFSVNEDKKTILSGWFDNNRTFAWNSLPANKTRIEMRNSVISDNISPEIIQANGSHFINCNSNGESGAIKIYGDYNLDPGYLGKINYSDQSYSSSATVPILFRGADHAITAPETSNVSATTEVWFATYRQATANWEVKGTVSGLQANRAASGVLYASDNGQVKFTITQNAPQEGDQFVFATIAAAGDANTQKKILFGPSAIAELNNQSRIVVEPGAKLEIKGTAEQPTLIDYEGTGGYGVLISGEIDAQYFDVNQINTDGIKITPTATITKFDNGSIRNVNGLGAHLSVDGIDHAFNNLNFDNTGAYDVKAINDANLTFVKSQRGRFIDSIADTSSVAWDDPILGYIKDNLIGPLSYDPGTKVLTVPFKIKEPNNLNCNFKSGSFQYSQDGGAIWRSVADSDLSGIGGSFASGLDFASAPQQAIYWNTGANYGKLEAALAVRFRVSNGYVYGDYGTSEVISFNLKPPVVRVLSPSGGELFSGGVTTTIAWSATDEGSGVADNSIDIYYDDGGQEVVVAENQPNNGSYRWIIPKINSASLKIKVRAYDKVGEMGEVLSDAVFSIDSIPPAEPTINQVKSPTVLSSQTLSGWKSADTKHIYVNGSKAAVAYPDNNSWNYSASLSDGKNTFSLYAQDEAGNNSAVVIATIEVKAISFASNDSSAMVTLPLGSLTEEVQAIDFELVPLPAAPMRGARAGEKAIKISARTKNGDLIEKLTAAADITLAIPAGVANPRVYFWNSAEAKWNPVAATVQARQARFNSINLGTFAVFDIIDTQGPTISNFKVGGRKVVLNDSIPALPEVTMEIKDNYGIDVGVLSLSVDGQAVKSLQAGQVRAQDDKVGASGTYRYVEKNPLPLGPHTFTIVVSDEVGNGTTFSETLYVIGASVTGLMVYPNPYTLGGGTLKFDGLAGDVYVYLYDVAADLVWKGFTSGAASISWDGNNHAGNQVAPGIYFYVVKDSLGNKTTGKIAVIK